MLYFRAAPLYGRVMDCGTCSRWRPAFRQSNYQPEDQERWAAFEATLSEQIAEPFELPVDKSFHPKVSPPRAAPAVVELKRLRTQLGLPGVLTIAIVVLLALWIAKQLWH